MAVEGAGANIVKYLVLIFNFIFFVFGLILFGVGIWANNKLGPYIEISSVNYATGPRVVIAVGFFIAVVAFLGCCGAWKEHRCMLICFFSILFLMLILEIVGGALAYSNKGKIEDRLDKDVQNGIKNYPKKNMIAIDDMQSKLKCCGEKSFLDWKMSADYNKTGNVPNSCCKNIKNVTCAIGHLKPGVSHEGIYTEGCFLKLKDMIESSLVPIGALAITVLVIQLLGMVFALVLICRIKKE